MSETVTAYRLSWPRGYERTPPECRQHAKFKSGRVGGRLATDLTVSQACDRLFAEIRRFTSQSRALRIPQRSVVISSNLPSRADGLPYSDNRKLADPGVAVYFEFDRKPTVMACDKWSTVADNIAAIAKTLEAMRALERHGVAECERAFTGFAALPAPGEAQARTCWVVLGIAPTQSRGAINAAWRARSKAVHPDVPGGSHEAQAEVNGARGQALLQATEE